MNFDEFWDEQDMRFKHSNSREQIYDVWVYATKAERESCAKVCEERHINGNWKYDTRHECAEAIRERSNTGLK